MHPCLVCEQRLESQCQRCLSSSLSASIQRRLGGQATSKYDKPHTNADMGMRVRTFHMLAVVQSLVSKAHKAGRKGGKEGRRGDKQKGCLCGRVEFVVGFFFCFAFFPFFFCFVLNRESAESAKIPCSSEPPHTTKQQTLFLLACLPFLSLSLSLHWGFFSPRRCLPQPRLLLSHML